MEKKKVPFEEQVANNIIKALENGTAPWVKPWKGSELSDMAPINLTTNKPYNGINFVNLLVTAIDKGYTDPRWMTFNQAKSVGAKVKKGEKASLVKFYKFTEMKEVLDEDGKPVLDDKGKPVKEEVKLENPKVVWHYVFNAQQCENIPELERDEIQEAQREFEAIEAVEKILENSGADIRHIEGNRAYYSPIQDFIVLPKREQFLEAGGEIGYYSTALHELGHWTGHESRLNRDMGDGFGTPSYAKEELRAEIASFMMCSKLGLDFDPEQHYAYIGSWVKTLKEDPKEITRASRDAMKITNFVLDLQKEKMMSQDQDKTLSKSTEDLLNKLQNDGVAGIAKVSATQAAELVEQYGVAQAQCLDINAIYTELDFGVGEKAIMTQLYKGNGEVHTAIENADKYKEDYVKNPELFMPGTKFVTDPKEMVTFKENHLLKEIRTQLNKGEYNNLDYTIALAKHSSPEEIKECINWMDKTIQDRWNGDTAKSKVGTALDNLSKEYQKVYERMQMPPSERISHLQTMIEAQELAMMQAGGMITNEETLLEMEGELNSLKNELDELQAAHDQNVADIKETKQGIEPVSKILENTITQGKPYELVNGTVIMEHLTGETVDNIKSEGLYIFTGEPGKMHPTTPLSKDEATKLIKEDLLSRVAKEADKVGYSVMDNEDKENSYTIFDDGGAPVMTGNFNEVSNALKELPNLRHESMTQIIKREINRIDGNYYKGTETKEDIVLDAKLLKETLLDGKINFEQSSDKGKIESQLNELRNAIIYAQSEILQDKMQGYTKAVLESTVSMLKEAEATLEVNLGNEIDYSKQIKENHRKLMQRDGAKTSTEAVFTEKTYLSVKYEEKEAAKRAGAKWDKDAKSWYAPAGASKEKLRPWTFEHKEIQETMQNNTQNIDPAADFKEVLEQNGFVIDGLPILDGKIHRIDVADKKRGNKNGWYRGFSDGRPNAVFGDYTKGQDRASTGMKWKSMSSNFSTGYDPAKAAEMKAEYEAKKAAADKELYEAQLKTADMLDKEFASAPAANDQHPYLKAKDVKNHDLKLDKRGNLLMPLRDAEGKLWAVQRIGRPDPKTGKTFKMIGAMRTKEEKAQGIQHPAKMDGTFFVIDEKGLSDSKQIVIVEGYSTGATVHEATKLPVVVAVHSGNLEKVAESLAKKYPEKQIMIAGDNDLSNELKGKDNVGKLKAEAAALAVKGEVALPSFTKEELANGASDWNDLAKSRGIKEVKKQLDIALKRLKNRETAQKVNKTQEQNQQQNKIRRREVVRKQSLSIAK
jgi:antirestriction protein ArdC/phage/plasmid primase-like uncharacterized protein